MSSNEKLHSTGERRPANMALMSFLQISARYLGYDELPGALAPCRAELSDAVPRSMGKEAFNATLR
jgi:hypothetical protein